MFVENEKKRRYFLKLSAKHPGRVGGKIHNLKNHSISNFYVSISSFKRFLTL